MILSFLINPEKRVYFCDLSCVACRTHPTFEAVILSYSSPIFICLSPQKNVDFLANLSYHTTNLGAPQKRRTPCCISLLQQGGFHTTGILQTNRNTWIQGTRKTFKNSESYTISRKITTYYIVAQQFGALHAGGH